MPPDFEHAYPPAEWTMEGIKRALQTVPETFPIPTYADAAFWERAASDPVIAGVVDAVRAEADRIVREPVVPLPASDYLGYERTGRRDRYATKQRGRNLGALVVAECLDRSGAYLDPALDYVWAMCEQSTWTRPAHLRGEERFDGLPRPVAAEERTIALQTAINAKLLAEARYVLGDQLHPAARERVVAEIDERVLAPFLARDDYHWQQPPTANHNAVCNASIMIAALHAEPDPERQAAIVAKAARSMRHYLEEFDRDGCTGEGVGYWKFGFGFYTQGAVHLETRTDGAYSLFSPPIAEAIATFPLQIELSPNRFPAFSDADEHEDITPYLTCKLGEHLDRPILVARGRADLASRTTAGYFSSLLRNIAWRGETVDDDRPTPPIRSYFEGRQWWVSRADPAADDGLVIAAKGGHNGESHNHNDCGSFVCHFAGESSLTDPGRGEYVDGYFSEDRYEFLAARSLGHSVPVVNGYEQRAGRAFGARVTDRSMGRDRDRLVLDLAGCYPADACIERLERTFVLDRTTADHGAVTLTDAVTFEDAADRPFESVLVSYAPMERVDDGLIVGGDRTTTEVLATSAAPVEMAIERIEDAIKDRDLWRARFVPDWPDGAGSIALSIRPSRRD